MRRRELLERLVAIGVSLPGLALAATPKPEVQVFKSRTCSCCAVWVGHLREAGFKVTVLDVHDASVERRRLGMPDRFGSCHTALVDGYVIEGHVPAAEIERLLSTRPKALGLSVPGMPTSAPGMAVPGRPQPYQVLLIDLAGQASTFASYRG
jgi:hypothetical protein